MTDRVKCELPKRFSDKIDFSGECWLWTSYLTPKGYGQYLFNKKNHRAHRYSWELFNGDIPEGLHVLHKCDVRNCVNPDHLFLGTHQENIADMVRKNRNQRRKGEEANNSKLTQFEVDEIRRTYIPGKIVGVKNEFSQRGLARKYKVSQPTIRYIISNKTYNSGAIKESVN